MNWIYASLSQCCFPQALSGTQTSSCSNLFMALALLLLHTALKWPILMHSVHVFPYGLALSRAMAVTTISKQVCFVGMFVCMCHSRTVLVHVCFFIIFSLSNSFVSVRLLMMVDWALCASTLFTHDNTFSLMIFFHFYLSLWAPRLFILTYECHLNHGQIALLVVCLVPYNYTLLLIVAIYPSILQHFPHPVCLICETVAIILFHWTGV